MLFQNVGCIIRTPDLGILYRTYYSDSRVLYLTPGSRFAIIKSYREGSWLSYERTIHLPYAFSGSSEIRIWMIADTHIGYSGCQTYLEEAIADIDSEVAPQYVIHAGDCIHGAPSEGAWDIYMGNYISAKSASGAIAWKEIAGNHDAFPDGGGVMTKFNDALGYDDENYTWILENICFVMLGCDNPYVGHYPPYTGGLEAADLTWLETQIQDNQDKNVFVVSHFGIYDTTDQTTQTGFFRSPVADVQTILDDNRVDVWFHGHVHRDDAENLAVYDPLEQYIHSVVDISEEGTPTNYPRITDSVSISESIKIRHCKEGASKSVYGTFYYGQRKYGKNVTICEAKNEISDSSNIKINDGYKKDISDSLSISESLAKESQFAGSKSDSISLSENLVTALDINRSLSDSMTIDDGFGIGYAINLSDSVSIDTLIEIESEEGENLKTNWKFLIKNSSGDYIASLVNARSRWFIQRLNDQSEAGFILDADDDNCDATILALGQNELEIEYKGVVMWAGQLVSARKIADGNSIHWEVVAKDWVSLLSKRFIGVESLREFTTIDAGTIAWTLIDETQTLANGDFGITEGTIEASITRSPSYDRKNLLEAIRELSNMGKDGESSYGFDFEITTSKVFNVYYPYKGTIRNDVVFRYPGNCENFEALVDSWGIINQEWGLGRHWTGNTAIVSRADATSQVSYKRREAIKNYHDMSVLAFLQDMVYQDIQWSKDTSTIVRFNARVDNKVGLTDYEVGDGVTVVCDKFDIDEWLWVYERKIEIGDDDEPKVILTVGN